MRYSFRKEEDWLLLGLGGLLVYVLSRALQVQMWWLVVVSGVFLAATLMLLRRMMRARWCDQCQRPMPRVSISPGQQTRLYYRCDGCGRQNDSGIELNWPE